MDIFEKPVERLIREFTKMPTVGPKTAQRLAFFIIKSPPEEVEKLCAALTEVKEKIRLCTRCFNLAEGPLCRICGDAKRNAKTLCIVADFKDLAAIERTGEFRGLYHVLGGLISPIDGIGPDEIRIHELLTRIKEEGVEEMILATNPNINGEATALYITKLLASSPVKITRIAYGLPVGAHLEFADDITIAKALEGRTSFGSLRE
jgi:recombination protein RecR